MAAVATTTSAATLGDSQLVALVRGGDDTAFAELYARYQPRLLAHASRLLRDPARAEDVIQDAFLSALRRLRETDAPIQFKPWIFEIVRNGSIDHLRSAGRAQLLPLDEPPLTPHDAGRLVGEREAPEPIVLSKESLGHLRTAFDELTDMQLRVLLLRELEGRSYDEIARELGLSRGSVESTLFRARREVGRLYEQIDSGERCREMGRVIAQLAEGIDSRRQRRRLVRHARRCSACRHRATQLGVDIRSEARLGLGALIPLPFLRRSRDPGAAGTPASAAPASASTFNQALTYVPVVAAHGGEAAMTGWGKAVAFAAAAVLAGGGVVHSVNPDDPSTPAAPPAVDGLHTLLVEEAAAGPFGPGPESFTPAPSTSAEAVAAAADAGVPAGGASTAPGAAADPFTVSGGDTQGGPAPSMPDGPSMPGVPDTPGVPGAPDVPSGGTPPAAAPPPPGAPGANAPAVDPPAPPRAEAPDAPRAPDPPQAPAAPSPPPAPEPPTVHADPPEAPSAPAVPAAAPGALPG